MKRTLLALLALTTTVSVIAYTAQVWDFGRHPPESQVAISQLPAIEPVDGRKKFVPQENPGERFKSARAREVKIKKSVSSPTINPLQLDNTLSTTVHSRSKEQ